MTVREFLSTVRKDAIDTATGGQLSAENAQAFINEVIAQNAWLQLYSIRRNIRASTANMDTMNLAARQLLAAVEGTAPSTTSEVTITRRTLTLTELLLPYDVTDSFLESNIEGENVTQVLNNVFATAFANDLTDLSVIGDEDSGTAFIALNDGYIDIAEADASVNDFDTDASTDYKGTVFPGMLAAMPDKWKADPSKLAFIVSSAVREDYLDEVGARASGAGDAALIDGVGAKFHGIPVLAHPYMPTAKLILTNPKNLWVGFGRDITYELQRQARKRLTEYTITTKVDFNYALSSLVVLAENFA